MMEEYISFLNIMTTNLIIFGAIIILVVPIIISFVFHRFIDDFDDDEF